MQRRKFLWISFIDLDLDKKIQRLVYKIALKFGKNDEMRYDVIPSVIYTDPEVASVGFSKEAAEERAGD